MRAQLSRWTPRRLVPLAFATLGLAVFFVAHTRTDWRSSWRHQPPVAHEPAVQAMSARVAMQAAPATAARSTEDEGVHALPPARAPAVASSGANLLWQLQRIEVAHTTGWNTSKVLLLLGHKANRDFQAYAWAFRKHGYHVMQGPPLVYNRNGVFLEKRPAARRRTQLEHPSPSSHPLCCSSTRRPHNHQC